MQNNISSVDCFRIITPKFSWDTLRSLACTCSELNNEIIKVLRNRIFEEFARLTKPLNFNSEVKNSFKILENCYTLTTLKISNVVQLSKCLYPLYIDEAQSSRELILNNFISLNLALKDPRFLVSLSNKSFLLELFKKLYFKNKYEQSLELATYSRECCPEAYNLLIAKIGKSGDSAWFNAPSVVNHYFEMALCESIKSKSIFYNQILNKITAQHIKIYSGSMEKRLDNLNELYKFFPSRFSPLKHPLEKLFCDLQEIFTQTKNYNFAKKCEFLSSKIVKKDDLFIENLNLNYSGSSFLNLNSPLIPNHSYKSPTLSDVDKYLQKTIDEYLDNSSFTELPALLEQLNDGKIKFQYIEKICTLFSTPFEFNEFIWKLTEPPLIMMCFEKLCSFYLSRKQFDEAAELVDNIEDKVKKTSHIIEICDFYLSVKQIDKAINFFKKIDNNFNHEEFFCKMQAKIDLFENAYDIYLSQNLDKDEVRFSHAQSLLGYRAYSLAFDCANKIFASKIRHDCLEHLFIGLKLNNEEFYQYLDILDEMEEINDRREFILDTVGY